MTKVPYSKPPLTYEQQLNQLKSRGLIIEDEGIFLDILERKSYYRLSGYWYPLLKNKKKHLFKEGASFSTAYHIYCFDKNLRQLVINELEKIEIAVRAKMIYIFSHQFGPFWYTDASIFKNKKIHSETISKIRTEFERSDARFIHAFKKKYNNTLRTSWTDI